MMRRTGLSSISAKKLAELAAAGQRPYSTLTARSTLGRSTARLDRKPPVKATRPADTGPDAATVAVVVEREQGRCVRCAIAIRGERGRDWSIQHRRARGSGGDRRPETNQAHNLLLMCGSGTTLCHGWVEHNPTAAAEHGWAISRYADPAAEFVDHAIHGRVWLLADGGISHRAPGQVAA